MPIVRPDRVSGSIYVIANSADSAQDRAIEHLHDKTDPDHSYNVFDHQDDATKALYSRYRYESEPDRVYAVSLDISPVDD